MVTHLLAGVILTGALILSLIFSGFILFVVVSSQQQMRTGNSLLLLQLGSVNGILAVLFLVFSTPSLLQGEWLTSKIQGNFTRKLNASNLKPSQSEPSYSLMAIKGRINIPAMIAGTLVTIPLADVDANSSSIEASGLKSDVHSIANSRLESSHNHSNDSRGLPSGESFEYSQNSFLLDDSGVMGMEKILTGEGLFCQLYGWTLITLHIAAVWLIVGLQCDKFCAIAAPLRYNTLVTRRRIAIYSFFVWVVAVLAASSPLITAHVYIYIGGACLPAWHVQGSLPHTLLLSIATLFIPGVVITGVNSRILVIARYHQHRIFSAIFEVMMSAQATVTHQKSPFPAPKSKTKSTTSVIQQLLAFLLCYCPLFVVAIWETCVKRRINPAFETLGVGMFLVAPLINSFVYGIKCKSLRKSFKNYLRKRLYKSEVKSEIEARVPSGQLSRRPSNSSSIGMPFIHRTLKRRMSDYLMKDLIKDDGDETRMVRRSSDLSWHPLDDRTPSPNRLRKPLDIKIPSDLAATAHNSVSQYLTVPSFEAARSYCQLSQLPNNDRQSICSGDSDAISETIRQNITEEEQLTTPPDDSPLIRKPRVRSASTPPGNQFFHDTSVTERSLPDNYRKFSMNSFLSRESQSWTPLLISAYEKPHLDKPINASSPYVVRTLEALMSINLSQSLLKASYFWKAKSKESLNDIKIKISTDGGRVTDVSLEATECVPNSCQELTTFSNHNSAKIIPNGTSTNGNINNCDSDISAQESKTLEND